jgi:hypothetical protein
MALKRATDAVPPNVYKYLASRRARGWWTRLTVMLIGTASGADLGGSSKYSKENIED